MLPEEARTLQALRDSGRGPTDVGARLRLFDGTEPRVTLWRDQSAWCPYCHKVWLQLEEKRIPHKVEKICMHCYHGSRRSIRSIGRSRDRIDRFDRFDEFSDFLASRGAGDLSGVKVSALHDAWRPKKRRETKPKKFGFLVKFDFDRFDNPFDTIDNVLMGAGGPPW